MSTSQERDFRSAALLMVGSGLLFTVMVSLVKVARSELDPISIMFWRSVVALPVAWAWGKGARPESVPKESRPWLIARCALGFGAMFGFFYASAGVGVGELGFISKLQPILLAILAPLLLGRSERVSPHLWALIATSFLGVGILLYPKLQGAHGWGDLLSGYGMMAVFACLCSAMSHLCVRRLGRYLSAHWIVLYFQLFVGLVSTLVLLIQGNWRLPDPSWIPLLLGVGLSSTVGQLFLTKAYSRARAARVSAMSYISPIWGILIDALFFGVLPGAEIWLGGALIMAGGLGLLRAREKGR